MTPTQGDALIDLPRSVLDRAMRSVLAQLELVSNGTTTSYNRTGGSAGDSADPRPRGGIGAPHLYWRAKYENADSNEKRCEVIDGARDELRHLTGRGMADVERPQGESRDERDVRIVAEGEGWTAREVAVHFCCAERDVRRARARAGVDPTYGKRLTASALAPNVADRRCRALELRAQGHSVTAIALLLKVDKATVSRDLKRDAA